MSGAARAGKEEAMAALAEKSVVLTGASRGIGRAAAHALVAAGAQVALLARDGDALSELAGELGQQAVAIPCDVGRRWEVAAAMEAAASTLGRIDALIINAAVIEPIAPLTETDPEAWARLMEINLTGVFHCLHAALPFMLAGGGGTVLSLSSGAAHRPLEGWSGYCASKAGAAMLLRSVDLEYRDRGIRAIGLSPGTVDTDMQGAIRASGIGDIAGMDRSEHLPPETVAAALVWLAGPEAADLAGQEVSLRDAALRARMGLSA